MILYIYGSYSVKELLAGTTTVEQSQAIVL